MILHADEERLVRQLHRLHEPSVRGKAAERQARRLKLFAVIIVEFIAVAVALGDLLRAVAARHGAARRDLAGIAAQAQRAALVDLLALAGHEIDDLVRRALVKLAGIGLFQPRRVARELDHRDLHAQADAEVRHMMLAGVLRRQDHALHAAVTETARHDDAVHGRKQLLAGLLRDQLGVNPLDRHLRIQRVAGVTQRLRDGEVRVVQLHILAHQADLRLAALMADAPHEVLPLGQVRLGRVDVQLAADDAGQVRLFQHQRRLVEDGQRQVLDDAVRLHVAEARDLAEDALVRDLLIHAQHDHVRRDAHALQLLDGVLRGLGLVLAGGLEVRHERHMDVQRVLPSDLQAHLADRLQEGLALDVADGAADLGDHHVRVRLVAHAVNEALDLVGDVRNGLHRAAQIAALAFAGDDIGIHLAGGEVGELVEILVDKALVMAQIQVRLRAVLGHIDLAMLIRAHRARVHVDVRIQLLRGHLQAARLEQPAQRGRRDALAQTRDNAACHKDVFFHAVLVPPSIRSKQHKKEPGAPPWHSLLALTHAS